MTNFWETNQILRVVTGSVAYGMNTPDSDIDTRGVCIPPVEYLLGLEKFEQHEDNTKDEVIYGLDKFIRLAIQNNPNILEILYAEDDCIQYTTRVGQNLISHREQFISKEIYRTYGGYAKSRMQVMMFKAQKQGKSTEGKRRELYDKYGYDTKDAAHVIRLLDTATEALQEGCIQVRRPDAKSLLDIRNGALSLD